MKLSLATFLLSVAAAAGQGLNPSPNDIHFVGEGCVNYYENDDWTLFEPSDDYSQMTGMGITFQWFTEQYSDVYINSNGNVSFRGTTTDYLPNDLENPVHDMIAPFWADVDTFDQVSGRVHYKTVGDKFVVVWDEVAEYEHADLTDGIDKRNTFEVVLSDVGSSDPKICFCYCQMEWAQADKKKNGSTIEVAKPATVGINPHDIHIGEPSFILGRFGYDAGTPEEAEWNGYGTGTVPPGGGDDTPPEDFNGVKHLEGRSFCFDTDIVDNPPVGLVNWEAETVGVCGDPHFKTWKGEHFEYHGQCDLVIAKDPEFADGLGLDVHIRTKLVRFWSYIKNAVIRIGDDVLEIEGSSMEGVDKEVHYWINYEYQGELTEFAGFPVTISSEGTKSNKNRIEIDLSSKYPGQKITLATFKEFVKVDFGVATVEAFGNTVGMLGDFKSGKTIARDGATVLDSYAELGHEWQVLPSDGKFFREASEPQFPKKCIDPEDPQGDRRRRLAESTISVEEAEAACAGIKSALDRKDCVYDILATQDMDMVGAF